MERAISRDRSSGRYHVRFRDGPDRQWATPEGCNAAKAGAFEIVGEIPDSTDPKQLCQRCFPPVQEEDPDATQNA